MINGILVLLFTAGIYIYFWTRPRIKRLPSERLPRFARFKVHTHTYVPSRPEPVKWDYHEGIPPWNTALMMVSGFNPHSYTSHAGDADPFFGVEEEPP